MGIKYSLDKTRYGGFHGHGGSHKWMVDISYNGTCHLEMDDDW